MLPRTLVFTMRRLHWGSVNTGKVRSQMMPAKARSPPRRGLRALAGNDGEILQTLVFAFAKHGVRLPTVCGNPSCATGVAASVH